VPTQEGAYRKHFPTYFQASFMVAAPRATGTVD
jgi:hypothetical protein